MKTNIFMLGLSLLSMTAIAQKDQVRNAEDALEEGNYAEAKAQLKVAEQNLGELNDRWTEDFYFFKGKAYMGTGANATAEDLTIAAESFKKAAEMGSDEAQQQLTALNQKMVESAQADLKNENYESGVKKLKARYDLNPKDTIFLYYAASTAYSSEQYEKALEYSNKLVELGFDGSGKIYTAVDKDGNRVTFADKNQMDLMMKTGEYSDEKVEKEPSKKGEVASIIAGSYTSMGESEKAVEALQEAKALDPENISLLQAEANIYIQQQQLDKAKDIFEQMAEIDPDNPQIYNNIGLIYAQELENHEKAIENYKKAIELDPNAGNYYINLYVSSVNPKEQALMEEMNNLGMSKADNERYDELTEERKQLYRDNLPILLTAIEKNPENEDLIRTAMNIYSSLGEKEKMEEMKAKLNN
ncbi:tetratricopeptide repeat protein [Gramella sp. GC03-9]|uniref:Tetratricopeptide repeat protein n=1 Tax=Christiangramia oceanisediminis TaxID=2920386 RepID=A0A9X2KY03_9FLAO|nr:tetratricopeptide repeat protein [Gramella oceanisediminis]MCP9200339.1 tetratricopeptide repeat protein [Gramella oceanisediminis]